MNNGKIIIGLILIAVAIYLFIYMTHPAAKYLASAIMAILGIAGVAAGAGKCKWSKK